MKNIELNNGARVSFNENSATGQNQASFVHGSIVASAFSGDTTCRAVIFEGGQAQMTFDKFNIEVTASEAIELKEIMTENYGFTFSFRDMREEK